MRCTRPDRPVSVPPLARTGSRVEDRGVVDHREELALGREPIEAGVAGVRDPASGLDRVRNRDRRAPGECLTQTTRGVAALIVGDDYGELRRRATREALLGEPVEQPPQSLGAAEGAGADRDVANHRGSVRGARIAAAPCGFAAWASPRGTVGKVAADCRRPGHAGGPLRSPIGLIPRTRGCYYFGPALARRDAVAAPG